MYKPEDINLNNFPTRVAEEIILVNIEGEYIICNIVYVAPHELSARSNLSFDQPTISKS